MDRDWQLTTLGEICDAAGGEIQTGPFGSQLHKADYVEQGVPVVPTSAISRRLIDSNDIPHINTSKALDLEKHSLLPGDILFARRGVQATGLSALAGKKHHGWIAGTGIIRLRLPPTHIDPRFLSFVLSDKASFEWLRQHAVGSTMPNLNERVIRRFPLRLPPLQEQLAIADVLGALDSKIELNREMNRTLEAMAQAIFRSWFVDFEPVVAKADGRKPFGMSDEIAALFPDRFVESEMGRIPEGWKVIPFSELIEIQGGGTPNTSIDEFWNGEIPWFSVVDTPEDGDVFVVNTERTITEAGLDGSSARLLEQGTTIITARGTVGNLAVAAQPMAINQSCYGLTGRSGRGVASTYFGCQQLVSDLQQLAHGSVFDTITRATFSSARVVDCSPKVIAAFERTAAPLLERIEASVCESQTLAALRDLLLPKLLSGEIRVAEAERELEEAGA